MRLKKDYTYQLLLSWLFCFLLCPGIVFGQQQSKTTKVTNTIIDPTHSLDPFYRKLYQLNQQSWKNPYMNEKALPKTVSVVHIGDSHIQAGFFSMTIMNLLQEKFGSAGRGLIFPLKLARTNEPSDYLIRSASKWDKTLCIQQVQKLPIGLGGMSIKTNDENFSFEIRVASEGKTDHSFNKVTVFHHEKAPELKVLDPDTKAKYEPTKYPFATTITLDKKVNSLLLETTTTEKNDSAIYYGFSLENGNKGILYHAVGINGAQFRHYASVQDFAAQISLLTPELFIFSLGTNEAFRGRFVESRFFAEVDRIIDPIRKANPRALVLITTPPDCLVSAQSRQSHPNIKLVRQALVKYAQEKGFAYWDLYAILGGEGSAAKLLQSGDLSKDGVHFRLPGYTMLGKLFYNALISDYTEYVKHRF